jgi:hypothetical protein
LRLRTAPHGRIYVCGRKTPHNSTNSRARLDSEATDLIRPDSIKPADRQATDEADMDALDAIADSGPD